MNPEGGFIGTPCYELDRMITESKSKFGQDVEVHAAVYWSGNELVGPEGIEDESRWGGLTARLNLTSSRSTTE